MVKKKRVDGGWGRGQSRASREANGRKQMAVWLSPEARTYLRLLAHGNGNQTKVLEDLVRAASGAYPSVTVPRILTKSGTHVVERAGSGWCFRAGKWRSETFPTAQEALDVAEATEAEEAAEAG